MRGLLLLLAPLVGAAVVETRSGNTDECPGYKAVNIREHGQSLTADLVLAGEHCDSYGTDLENLKLLVEYQTGE